MKNRILIMISVIVLIAMVGCSQETVEVITSTTKQPTTMVTTTTTTTLPTTTQPIITTTKLSTTKVETTAHTTTKPTTKKYTTTKQQTTKRITTTKKAVTTTKKPKPTTTKKTTATTSDCKGKNDHWMMCGSIGKWYDTRADFQADYFKETNKWNELLDNEEIDWDTYVVSCPQGYECWSCPNCRKWTGNYKYP